MIALAFAASIFLGKRWEAYLARDKRYVLGVPVKEAYGVDFDGDEEKIVVQFDAMVKQASSTT